MFHSKYVFNVSQDDLNTAGYPVVDEFDVYEWADTRVWYNVVGRDHSGACESQKATDEHNINREVYEHRYLHDLPIDDILYPSPRVLNRFVEVRNGCTGSRYSQHHSAPPLLNSCYGFSQTYTPTTMVLEQIAIENPTIEQSFHYNGYNFVRYQPGFFGLRVV